MNPIDWPSEIPLETDPEVSAKRTAEMQQMTERPEQRKLLTERVAALEKEVGILKTGLGIILESIFGPHEGEVKGKTTDQMTEAEFSAELDKALSEIFGGEESLDPDEALKRALALKKSSK